MIILKRTKNILTKSALLPIYYRHIHSNLKYGILLWGSMLMYSQFKRLQKIQDDAVHMIDQHSQLQTVYLEQKIPDLSKLLRLEQQKMGYHLVTKQLPTNLQKLIATDHKGSDLCKKHSYNTRFKKEPNLPATKSSKYQNSFLHQCIKSFSILPNYIKSKPSLKLFVKSIKTL